MGHVEHRAATRPTETVDVAKRRSPARHRHPCARRGRLHVKDPYRFCSILGRRALTVAPCNATLELLWELY